MEAISYNYTPIILWLQEVDEQVGTDSEVKADGILLMMQKFNTYFYVKQLWMVIRIVESASAHSCRMLSLLFAKPKILFFAQKLLSLAQGMMPDLMVCGVEFRVLQKRTMLLMIQNCQDHEKFPNG